VIHSHKQSPAERLLSLKNPQHYA